MSKVLTDDSGYVMSTAIATGAHAVNHKSGGTDAIKLDELAAPTDVATLNASTSTHGLLRKLDNNASHFLDGTGAWSTPTVTLPDVVYSVRTIAAGVSLPAGDCATLNRLVTINSGIKLTLGSGSILRIL